MDFRIDARRVAKHSMLDVSGSHGYASYVSAQMQSPGDIFKYGCSENPRNNTRVGSFLNRGAS